MTLDSFGITGMAVDYAMILFFMGSALFFFLYLWKKKRLDFDEEAKFLMMKEDKDG